MVGISTFEAAPETAAFAAARRCLGECSAMTLDQIVERSGLPALTMARTLRRMGAGGQIEILRPLPGTGGRWNRGERRRRVFYRLVRDWDGDFVWQQRLTAPMPVSRFCSAKTLTLS